MGRYADVDIKRVVIDETTSGLNQIIAGVADKFIIILEFSLTVSAASIVQWREGAVNRTGPIPLAANQTLYAPYADEGHFRGSQTTGAAINLNSSAIVNQGGWVRYVELP